MSDLSDIAKRCDQVSNSPYMMAATPPELKKLREVVQGARALTRVDVPALIAEIRRLRIRSNRLEAELDALRSDRQP